MVKMFTDYTDENSLNFVIKDLANDFLDSDFNCDITGDFNLGYKVELYMKANNLNPKLANRIAKELLKHHQTKLNYSFE